MRACKSTQVRAMQGQHTNTITHTKTITCRSALWRRVAEPSALNSLEGCCRGSRQREPMCACTHTHTHTSAHPHERTHINHMHLRMHTHAHIIHMNICMCLHNPLQAPRSAHTRAHTHAHTHAHITTHTHNYTHDTHTWLGAAWAAGAAAARVPRRCWPAPAAGSAAACTPPRGTNARSMPSRGGSPGTPVPAQCWTARQARSAAACAAWPAVHGAPTS